MTLQINQDPRQTLTLHCNKRIFPGPLQPHQAIKLHVRVHVHVRMLTYSYINKCNPMS